MTTAKRWVTAASMLCLAACETKFSRCTAEQRVEFRAIVRECITHTRNLHNECEWNAAKFLGCAL
jgi:hypothetical protein